MTKRVLVVATILLFAALAAFANGNAEKLSTVDGTAQFVPADNGQMMLVMRTARGDNLAVDMSEQELVRLQVQNREQIRVRGVVIDDSEGTQTMAMIRILAREVTRDGNTVVLQEPIKLTDRDRDRIRLYDADQDRDQDRDKDQDGDGAGLKMQTRTQTQTSTQSGTTAQTSKR